MWVISEKKNPTHTHTHTDLAALTKLKHCRFWVTLPRGKYVCSLVFTTAQSSHQDVVYGLAVGKLIHLGLFPSQLISTVSTMTWSNTAALRAISLWISARSWRWPTPCFSHDASWCSAAGETAPAAPTTGTPAAAAPEKPWRNYTRYPTMHCSINKQVSPNTPSICHWPVKNIVPPPNSLHWLSPVVDEDVLL